MLGVLNRSIIQLKMTKVDMAELAQCSVPIPRQGRGPERKNMVNIVCNDSIFQYEVLINSYSTIKNIGEIN